MSVRLVTFSSPPSSSVAELPTLTCAAAASRPALPSVSVPLLTCTVPAADVPLSVLLPWLVSVPAPSCAVASVSPPSSVYCAATTVPVPARVPARVSSATVSVPPSCRMAPLATLRRLLSCRRSVLASTTVPPATVVRPV